MSIDGLGAYAGDRMVIDFQNENLVARRDGATVCTVPDLICIVETEAGEPITTELLRYGFRVTVLGFPAPSLWTTPEGLAVAGTSGVSLRYGLYPPHPLTWGARYWLETSLGPVGVFQKLSFHKVLGASQDLLQFLPELLKDLVPLGAVRDFARGYLGLQIIENALVKIPFGDMEEIAIEPGKLAGTEVAQIPPSRSLPVSGYPCLAPGRWWHSAP